MNTTTSIVRLVPKQGQRTVILSPTGAPGRGRRIAALSLISVLDLGQPCDRGYREA